jgi:predicted nucleotidyltransferase
MAKDTLSGAILETIAYASLFDFPLTKYEISLRLLSQKTSSDHEIRQAIDELIRQNKVIQRGQYYVLAVNSSDINAKREINKAISQEKEQIAKSLLSTLPHVPWLEAIFLTGSVAAGNAKKEDDIDILIISSQNRLWLIRMVLNLYLQWRGLRRMPGSTSNTNKFCLNMFLDYGSCAIPQAKRNIYTAHELLQSTCLYQKANVFRSYLLQNSWAHDYLANWYQNQLLKTPHTKDQQSQKLFKPWGVILSFFNLITYLLQKLYMQKRRTNETVCYHQAYFHPGHTDMTILKRFELLKKSIY